MVLKTILVYSILSSNGICVSYVYVRMFTRATNINARYTDSIGPIYYICYSIVSSITLNVAG